MKPRLTALLLILILLVAIDIALRLRPLISPTVAAPTLVPTLPLDTTIQPQTTRIAFQCYERGAMIWRSDSGTIYALEGHDGGRIFIFEGGIYVDLPEAAGTPPRSTLLLPQSGFGKVWASDMAMRSGLGWAIEPERTYDSLITSYSSRLVLTVPGGTIEISYLGGYYRLITPGVGLDCPLR